MKYYELRPLQENYKTIDLRCTQLSSFIKPFKYQIKDKQERQEVFSIGDYVESIIQQTVMHGKEAGKKQVQIVKNLIGNFSNYKRSKKNKEIEFVSNNLETISESYYPEIGKRDLANFRVALCLGCSGYLVIFSGEVDMCRFGEAIVDIKTSSKDWSPERHLTEKQQFYYTFLHCVYTGAKGMEFSYWINRKTKKFKSQTLSKYITFDEAKKVVVSDLYDYLLVKQG